MNDLLKPEAPKEARHAVIRLFSVLCQYQQINAYLRGKFFSFIKSHEIIDDTIPRFEFLKALTDNGKDVTYFDERIGVFILRWIATTDIATARTNELMKFLNNLIKFNQSFLDQEVLNGIIQ